MKTIRFFLFFIIFSFDLIAEDKSNLYKEIFQSNNSVLTNMLTLLILFSGIAGFFGIGEIKRKLKEINNYKQDIDNNLKNQEELIAQLETAHNDLNSYINEFRIKDYTNKYLMFKKNEKYDECLIYIKKCILIDSKNAQFHLEKARTHLHKGQFKESCDEIELVIENTSIETHALTKIEYLLFNGDLGMAVTLIKKYRYIITEFDERILNYYNMLKYYNFLQIEEFVNEAQSMISSDLEDAVIKPISGFSFEDLAIFVRTIQESQFKMVFEEFLKLVNQKITKENFTKSTEF